jgi:hypothetical protein
MHRLPIHYLSLPPPLPCLMFQLIKCRSFGWSMITEMTDHCCIFQWTITWYQCEVSNPMVLRLILCSFAYNVLDYMIANEQIDQTSTLINRAHYSKRANEGNRGR